MINVWRKGASHSKFEKDCEITDIHVMNDEVVLEFSTSGGRGITDFQIVFSSDSRLRMIEALLKSIAGGKPKNITDYTEEELYAALKQKMLNGVGDK